MSDAVGKELSTMKRAIASISCAALLCVCLAGCSSEGDDLESQAEARQRTPPNTAGKKPPGSEKVGIQKTESSNAGTETKAPAGESGNGG